MIDTALKLAEQGFYIFPVRPKGKIPLHVGWPSKATTDPDQIRTWWKHKPDCNIGIATGPSGLVVVDVDPQNGGYKTLDTLALENDFPLTCSVKTPSGGEHYYYRLPEGTECRSTASTLLGEGIDSRAKGGYVVGEGSKTDKGEYINPRKHPTAPAPEWLIDKLKRKAVLPNTPNQFTGTYDVAIDIAQAEDYLSITAPAIQGSGGDALTYRVCCELRDMGISTEKGVELLLEHFNPRCEPPWDSVELSVKMQNAYEFAQSPPGVKSLDIAAVRSSPKHVHCVSDLDPDIPPREWLIEGRIMAGYVTVTVAPGGVGKSMFTMLEAIAVATGLPLTGKTPKKQGAVLIYNTEDPQDEIERRILAICALHGIKHTELTNVFYMSGVQSPLRFVVKGQYGPLITKDKLKMREIIKEHNIILTVIDPFIRSHSVDENDNGQIDMVVQEMSNLAIETASCISVVHHTRKYSPQASPVGDMDIARGASSLVSSARIVHTLLPMSEAEAEELGIIEDMRRWYMRLDNAKGNMSQPIHKPTWFEKKSIELDNSDKVGAIILSEQLPVEADGGENHGNLKDYTSMAQETLTLLAPYLGTGDLPLDDVVIELSTLVPQYFQGHSLSNRTELMKKLFTKPVSNTDWEISINQTTLTVKEVLTWN